jgi:hypothetical protein
MGKSINGPLDGKGTRIFKSTPEGTQVTWQFEIETKGYFMLIGPLFGRWMKKTLEQDLALAKKLLESGVLQEKS